MTGPPGQRLLGRSLVIIGRDGAERGRVLHAIRLLGRFIPSNGTFVIGGPTFALGGTDVTAEIPLFEGNLTFALVRHSGGGLAGFDIDTDDDGQADTVPWDSAYDVVAVTGTSDSTAAYGPSLRAGRGLASRPRLRVPRQRARVVDRDGRPASG